MCHGDACASVYFGCCGGGEGRWVVSIMQGMQGWEVMEDAAHRDSQPVVEQYDPTHGDAAATYCISDLAPDHALAKKSCKRMHLQTKSCKRSHTVCAPFAHSSHTVRASFAHSSRAPFAHSSRAVRSVRALFGPPLFALCSRPVRAQFASLHMIHAQFKLKTLGSVTGPFMGFKVCFWSCRRLRRPITGSDGE